MPNGAGPLDTAQAAHVENPAAATATPMPVVPAMEDLETRLIERMISQFTTMGFFPTAAPQSAAPQAATPQVTQSHSLTPSQQAIGSNVAQDGNGDPDAWSQWYTNRGWDPWNWNQNSADWNSWDTWTTTQ